MAFWQILEDLLLTVIPAANLDVTQWQAESSAYLSRAYTQLIAKPTSVLESANELCNEVGFYLWLDERDNLVKVKAIRAANDDTVNSLSDRGNLVGDSIRLDDQADQQITIVIVHYAKRTPFDDKQKAESYQVSDVFVASSVEAPDFTDGSRIKTIYSQWLDAADGDAAEELGTRILDAFSIPPRKIQFTLEAKDRDNW